MLYKAGEILIKSYAKLMLKMDIRRQAELPDDPVLYAANHPSTTDPIFMHLVSPQPISVMITSKVFSIPVLGAYMRRMQQISVVPGQGERVLEEARQSLEKGRSVMIFSEGLISPPGEFHAPRSGVARLALQAGVPVVPLGISCARKTASASRPPWSENPTSLPGTCARRMPSPSANRSGSMATQTTNPWSRRLPKPSCSTSATWRRRAGKG